MYRKIRRLFPILLLFTMFLSMFSGCRLWDKSKQSVSYNLGCEPQTVDPALCTIPEEGDVILANFEGLMKLDKNNKAIPGIAESYKKDSNTEYTFKLREARWSDGKPVTAGDFEYAWKRILSPDTGSEYAYQLYYIKNGESYNRKQCSVDEVGVRALDERTLKVTLESPAAYFLEMTALPTYMPVRSDIIEDNRDKWAKSPLTYIGNGPFKMVSWKSGYSIEFTKNDKYYDAENIKLRALTFRMVEDPENYLSAWETGDIDVIESPPAAEMSWLESENKLTEAPYLGVYFYTFNTRVKPLNDKRVRKALTYAIDRPALIQNIVKNRAQPAAALIPNGIPDSDISRDFREAGGSFFKPEGQVAEAQRLLGEAGYPNGVNFPKLTLTCNNTGSHGAVAKAIQDMWKRNLGIDVNIQVQKWDVLQKTRISGNYEIIRNGWLADCIDPRSFMDLFVSGSGNNDSNYNNPAYDSLIKKVDTEDDQQKRIELLHQAEQILMDDMPVMPIYFYNSILLIKPSVKGVVKSSLGFVYFDNAYVEGK
jgi:ABC-type oligopeptide transport system, periplasmic component